jgi:hypothetical protein
MITVKEDIIRLHLEIIRVLVFTLGCFENGQRGEKKRSLGVVTEDKDGRTNESLTFQKPASILALLMFNREIVREGQELILVVRFSHQIS